MLMIVPQGQEIRWLEPPAWARNKRKTTVPYDKTRYFAFFP